MKYVLLVGQPLIQSYDLLHSRATIYDSNKGNESQINTRAHSETWESWCGDMFIL